MGLPAWPGRVGIKGSEVCREEPGGVESSSRVRQPQAFIWVCLSGRMACQTSVTCFFYLDTAFQQPCKVILRIK